MKKKLLTIFLCIGIILPLSACGQYGAKKFGGSYTIDLPKGERLVNVAWKDSDLWYLTEPMDSDYKPKEYKFKEDSTFGVFEGTVTIVEHK